jgi:glycosyltransferase involved in cell wall biosynthesis
MWTFSGTEHYGADSPDARWRSGYTSENRVSGESGYDIDRAAWERKKKFWKQPMHLVPASSWLADRAAHSEIAHSWPITRIAHVIDTNIFSPMDRSLARARHSLPTDVPLVLFLSSAGIADHRKGWELLQASMTEVKSAFPLVELVVAGPASPAYTHPAGIPITWIGQVEGNEALQSLYASANVVAVPSKEDNMPLTAMEAQSVGVPVAAFDIGGLPDIVLDGVTGSLAPAFEVSALASGIIDSLGSAGASQGLAARSHSLETWSPKVVVESYLEIYQQEIASHSKH